MPQFKRIRLFSNISTIGPDNILYDEVWVYKLTSDSGTIKQKYRIRYQRTDDARALGFSEDDMDGANMMLEQFGPAVSCTLEVWHNETWNRCLDWMGDPGESADDACRDLNEQFKAFITCTPIKEPFTSNVTPPIPPRRKKTGKKPPKNSDDSDSEPSDSDSSSEEPDFTWI